MKGCIFNTLLFILLKLGLCISDQGKLKPELYLLSEDLFRCSFGTPNAPTDPAIEVYVAKPVIYSDDGIMIDEGVEKIIFENSTQPLISKYLDSKLPAKIFINGYNLPLTGCKNQDTPIKNTWMYEVAQLAYTRSNLRGGPQKFNYIIIYWNIPNFHATSFFENVSYYHKTLSKYKDIVAGAAARVDRIIDYFQFRSKKGCINRSERLRNYIGKFEIYGHSLGAHIAFHMIKKLSEKRGASLKFGKVVGLDPAKLCFGDFGLGINGVEGEKFAHETVVVHSSSGLVGIAESDKTIEISPNGGTFQPGCTKTDLSCSHSRAWLLYTYQDDSCQMVAYTCINYDQFKIGACFHPRKPKELNQAQFRIVNLPEQHFDDPHLLKQADLAPNETGGDYELLTDELDPVLERTVQLFIGKFDKPLEGKHKRYFHLLTGALDERMTGSHCLQHYQIRMAILNTDYQSKCAIHHHTLDGATDLSIVMKYVYEDSWCSAECKLDRGLVEKKSQKLVSLMKGRLYTALMTNPGDPLFFTGATIENIDFDKWSECVVREKIDRRFTFILDIAFMSNITPEIRRYFSTILCGKWVGGTNTKEIKLSLCNRTKLLAAGRYVDTYLLVNKDHGDNPWYTNLLNFFYKFSTGWSPFRSIPEPSTKNRASYVRKRIPKRPFTRTLQSKYRQSHGKGSKKHPQH